MKDSYDIIRNNIDSPEILETKIELELTWPPSLSPCFVISINEDRWKSCLNRLSPISEHLIKWEGTNGREIDKNRWIEEGLCREDKILLNRGLLGCYDSHFRIWKHMLENKIPKAVIFEDDVDIKFDIDTLTTITESLDELEDLDPKWDLLFISRNYEKSPNIAKIGKHLSIPGESYGAFAYALTFNAARILCLNALPITTHLDIYMTNQNLRKYSITPNLFYVTPVVSERASII